RPPPPSTLFPYTTLFRSRLRTCVESLSDKQVWWRPNEASNSIGNLILHLNGNVQQWLVASFSRLKDTRDRPAEFAAREGMPAAQDRKSTRLNSSHDQISY